MLFYTTAFCAIEIENLNPNPQIGGNYKPQSVIDKFVIEDTKINTFFYLLVLRLMHDAATKLPSHRVNIWRDLVKRSYISDDQA